ncbi:class II fructose-1,6-bisphosphate aldolase [Spiroplasma gladiatoris]|uniref:Class II fructose-1,6-bisphosphate aldolase n=1 Tax=Spiroplasma gladiatoris TaxID=2143 RepID=A0A4P7AHH8_9MOLU|nr:hypothetical protein [Spiroplasma gladiatoris]QBQ07647.1 class II fructose-1,6-bisphosphate aldolase [Spiroplasma gladiatoris]
MIFNQFFKMKKIFNTKNITICATLASIMVVLSLFSYFLSNITGKSIFQISDIVYLSMFVTTINPLVLIFSSCIAGVLIDLYMGGFIFIPFTIIIKILIGVIVYFLNKKIKIFFSIPIAYLCIYLYVIYVLVLYDKSSAVVELITDSIQYLVTVSFSLLIIGSKNWKEYSKYKKNNIKKTRIKS